MDPVIKNRPGGPFRRSSLDGAHDLSDDLSFVDEDRRRSVAQRQALLNWSCTGVMFAKGLPPDPPRPTIDRLFTATRGWLGTIATSMDDAWSALVA